MVEGPAEAEIEMLVVVDLMVGTRQEGEMEGEERLESEWRRLK